MLTGHTETLQSLSFDGPLAAWQGIVLGCILAALCFWTLFGVGRDARRKLGSVLFALRVVAIVVLVWLLLGPVRATTFRHFTPKSLAVVTDVSRSMNVVDPPDKQADLRWQSDGTTGSPPSLLSICDRAVSATALARDQLGWLLRNADPTSPNPASRAPLWKQRAGPPRRRSTSPRRFRSIARGGAGDAGPRACFPRQGGRLGPGRLRRRSNRLARAAGCVPPARARSRRARPLEKWHRQLVQSVRATRSARGPGCESPRGKQRGIVACRPAWNEILSRREKVDRLLKAGKTSWFSSRNGTRPHSAVRIRPANRRAGDERDAAERPRAQV